MEIHTDSHSVKDERRLGEHSGLSLSLEDQFIVKNSVVGNASRRIFDFLPSRPVGNDLELDRTAGHYPDLQPALGSGQPPDDTFLCLPADGYLTDNRRKKL